MSKIYTSSISRNIKDVLKNIQFKMQNIYDKAGGENDGFFSVVLSVLREK